MYSFNNDSIDNTINAHLSDVGFYKDAFTETESDTTLGINLIGTEQLQQIEVYPNPANNTLFVKLNKQPETSIQYHLYDIQGRQLINGNFNEQEYKIDISYISKGIYFISFTAENQTKTVKKIIKE
jgi:hypothetical protein